MNYKEDQQRAARWAKELIHRSAWCVLDTETTGLGGKAEICQIALTDKVGAPLLNTLVKPTVSIPSDATAIHGITDADVKDAPSFDQVFLQLLKAAGDREVVIYNANYDLQLIRQSLLAHGIYVFYQAREFNLAPNVNHYCAIWHNGSPVSCAMHFYFEWVGEWSSHHGNYRWQRLPGGDHSALGDCHATIKVIQRMAESYEPEPVNIIQQMAESCEPKPVNLVLPPPKPSTSDSEPDYSDIPF